VARGAGGGDANGDVGGAGEGYANAMRAAPEEVMWATEEEEYDVPSHHDNARVCFFYLIGVFSFLVVFIDLPSGFFQCGSPDRIDLSESKWFYVQ
jgi:hypothetical protein